LLRVKEVLKRTDKNTEIIMSIKKERIGSHKSNLHCEAVYIYRLCREFNINRTVEWIGRDLKEVADKSSQIEDSHEYKLDPSCFPYMDTHLGPHTVDQFTSFKSKQLDRFCCRFLNPGYEAF